MIGGDRYPAFDAPRPPTGTDPKKWTRAEVRTYFDWIVDHVEPRSTRLLEWLGIDDRPDHPGVLREVGTAAVERLRSPEFSGPAKPTPVVLKGREFDCDAGPALSDEGAALAADLGLLVARYLLADFRDQVRLEIGGRPKSWFWHNLPVLTGGGISPFDPVGASIGNAYGVLRRQRDASVWARMYEHVAATVGGGSAKPFRPARRSARGIPRAARQRVAPAISTE